jgi:superfamily I DNA/RNA helicase
MVWALHDAVTSSLRDSKLRLWSALPCELCGASPQQQARVERYDHILVDEGQFFAPSWFQLVKLAMKRDGQLFVCADPNQGFMRNRLSWKSVGLDVAGRTKKLRRSYRGTRAILQAAGRIIEALGADDGEDCLVPDYTGMEPGQPPLLVLADTPQDAQDRLVNELAATLGDAGVPLGAALVIYGEKVRKQDLYAALCQTFGMPRVWWFNEKTQKKAPPPGDGKDHLRMAYLDTATGLEASIVFLIGVENLFDVEEDDVRREDKARKLYMAMTRAGQRLVLLSSRRLPQAMEALFERAV